MSKRAAMDAYTFWSMMDVLDLLLHDEDFAQERADALQDASGQRLIARLLQYTHPDITDAEVAPLVESFIEALFEQAALRVEAASDVKSAVLQMKSVLEHDPVLRQSLTLREAVAWVSALRNDEESSLSFLDQLTGSYLLVKGIELPEE